MHHPIAIVAAGVVLVFVQIALALSGYSPMPGAEDALAGPDSYMRLLRVEVWANSEGWRDVGFPLSNAPYGETLHWTRPFDVLLLVGARPLGWLIGFRDGLYWWGAMISPLLQFASLLALSWATRAHLSNRAFVFLALLFVTQPALAAVYSVARPDHHSLLAFLFVIGVALFLRGLAGRLRCCGAAGVIGGLAIWVSIEGAAPVVVALGVLGAAWMVRGEWYLRGVIWYLTGVALALSVAMPLEHGFAALAALEYDRISIVHWGLIVVALTAAGLVERALRRLADPGWLARMIGGAAILAAPLMLVAFVFPDFLGGPFVEVDPALGAIWLDHIDEVQPLNAGDFAIYLGPSVLAGAYLAYKIWRRRQQGDSNSLGLIYLAVLLAVFGSLAAYQVRWSIYPAIVALAPWVLLLRAMFQQKIEWRLSSRIRIPLRTPLFLAVLSAPVAGGAILMSLGLGASAVAGLASQPKDGAACPWAQFAPTLRALVKTTGPEGASPIILGFVHRGPEIMYRAGVRVVGTPYHRNAAGILDTHRVLSAMDPEVARGILKTRGVDYLAFCRNAPEALYYSALKNDILYRRLHEGRAPDWLRSLDLPESMAAKFQVMQVVKE